MTLCLGTSLSSADEVQQALMLNTIHLCGVGEEVRNRMSSEFDEVPIAEGDATVLLPSGPQNVDLTFYANPVTLNYTILVDMPNGVTCILATGENFSPVTSDGI